jgi:hypothetical protein
MHTSLPLYPSLEDSEVREGGALNGIIRRLKAYHPSMEATLQATRFEELGNITPAKSRFA